MPFDGTDFPQEPARKGGPVHHDNAVSFIIIALVFCLLVAPFSMNALVDIVRYLRGA